MTNPPGWKRARQCGPGAAGAALLLVLGGCGEGEQSTLSPQAEPARQIADLFWWMMIGSWIGLALVCVLLVASWFRRARPGALEPDLDSPHPGDRPGWRVVVVLGVAVPLAALTALFTVSNVFVMKTTAAPPPGSTELTIEVVGHQWFWEVRYPGGAVTANEIHIPARTRVEVVVTTADVIHSFWVPRLNRKVDTIPGQRNRVLLYADRPGVYRGQCAEFCGVQHAHMAMLVFADPPAEFQAWLARQARPARPPTSELERRGQRIFGEGPCASCHTIRGTSASGTVGPDLTHLASRTTLAAATIPNRPDELGGWIVDSQHVKPGNRMPNVDLNGSQLQALLAYLESLA